VAKVGDLFHSKYLRADDLGTHRVRVTIAQVAIELMHGGKKPVLYFHGKSKGLVLNQTRAHSLARVLASDETNDWVGCQVTLYVDGITATDEHGRARRVRMICIDERPESALRPKREGEAEPPAGPPLRAEDVAKW
jgi:hypothetical protein